MNALVERAPALLAVHVGAVYETQHPDGLQRRFRLEVLAQV
jgi:hypothetical protein